MQAPARCGVGHLIDHALHIAFAVLISSQPVVGATILLLGAVVKALQRLHPVISGLSVAL